MTRAETPTRTGEGTPSQSLIARSLGHIRGLAKDKIAVLLEAPEAPCVHFQASLGFLSNLTLDKPVVISLFSPDTHSLSEAPIGIATVRKPHPDKRNLIQTDRLFYFEYIEDTEHPRLSPRVRTVTKKTLTYPGEFPQTPERLEAYIERERNWETLEFLTGFNILYDLQTTDERDGRVLILPFTSDTRLATEADILTFEADLQQVTGRPIVD